MVAIDQILMGYDSPVLVGASISKYVYLPIIDIAKQTFIVSQTRYDIH
jgi:hypothetical protein